MLERYKQNFIKEDAFGVKSNGKWIKFSTYDYINNANFFSLGLLSLGYKKGDKIASITNNRPEWNFIDMGMSQIGVIHVPIYPTISTEEYDFILKHADVKAVFVSAKNIFDKLKSVVENTPLAEHIYSFNEVEGVKNWTEIIELGKQNKEKYKPELDKRKNEIGENDVATLIYTSGTTGFPKGVMLSHKNLMQNAINTTKAHGLGFEHRTLSFLPLCHVYERMLNYNFQYSGISIYYAENMGKIIDNLKEIKPHIFSTVPRLLEKVYDSIIAKGKNLPPVSKLIFFWAIKLGLRYKLNGKSRLYYNLKLAIARKLVFKKWREALGGNVSIIVSGGAALQSRLERIFYATGIHVCVGYGLTETSPVIAVNEANYPNVRFGTVGKIIKDVQVKIADDGEILCKGPNIMQGYYKSPELTAETIDKDGWLHTGDIGIVDEDNFLTITDRKKEIFKMSGGKYVAPQIIENKFKESFFIEQLMVVGENEKFASALISPNFSFLHDWCSINKIQYRDNQELIQKEKVVALYQKEINKYNKKLGDFERIKRFRLVCEEWDPQSGELSPTLKLKRKFLYKKYNSILEEIYMHKEVQDDSEHLKRLKGATNINENLIKKIKFNSLQFNGRRIIASIKVSEPMLSISKTKAERKEKHNEKTEWKNDRKKRKTEKKNEKKKNKVEWKNEQRTNKTEWKNQRRIDKRKWEKERKENKALIKACEIKKVCKLKRRIEKKIWKKDRKIAKVIFKKDRKINKINWKKNRKVMRKEWRKIMRTERLTWRKERKVSRLEWKIEVVKREY